MIARISKVEIAGPKSCLDDVLTRLQEAGVLQIEPRAVGFMQPGDEAKVRAFFPDSAFVAERLFLERLRSDIDGLFRYLPAVKLREAYFEPRLVLDTVAGTIKKHTEECKTLAKEKETLSKEFGELDRYSRFFGTLETFLKGEEETPDLDFIGITMKYPEAIEPLKGTLDRLTGGSYDFLSQTAEDGSIVGLITTSVALSERVREALADVRVPEFKFRPEFDALSFPQKVAHLRQRVSALREETDAVSDKLKAITVRWGPIYRRVRAWIDERLGVIGASASAYQTEMCFFIFGWMPSDETGPLKQRLLQEFGGEVVLDEKEILEEDLDRVPVILKNPTYFKPFELFTRILPLPKYSSYDPTTFVGIFFPIFFGMILGDAGYGVVLALTAFLIIRKVKKPGYIIDAAKILGVASAYSIIFGLLYGEVFGELGAHYLGLKPLYFNRRTALLPMLVFAMAVGVFHIALGMLLGLLSAIKKKEKKEMLYKLMSLLSIMAITMIAASLLNILPSAVAKLLLMAAVIGVPLLTISGGMLAPLELLKSIGNVISYVRIMAIGLTSVLLAFVANRLGGAAGDIVLGILIAGLLHTLNIVLGIFSPTIHSIRLHYVEFFGKFLEPGGRRFEPLRKL